jgi:hypothetical protein
MELTLGTALYLARIPLSGVLMGLLGLLCLVTLRRLQPRVGVCALAGAVAVFLKVFSIGGLYPGPLIGIGAQAVLVELAFTVTASRRLGAALGGALALASSPAQMVLIMWAVAGEETVRAFARPIVLGLAHIGFEGISVAEVIGAMVAAVAALGAAGGLWAWAVAGRVARRVRGAR